MIIMQKKGLTNTSKRIVDLIEVRKQTSCFMDSKQTSSFMDLRVSYRYNKRSFSDSSNQMNSIRNQIGNQMNSIKVVWYTKINNLKLIITKWYVEMLKFFTRLFQFFTRLLNRLINRIRICLKGGYRWMNRRIRNLFLSIRRISKYRVPLYYVLIVNILSVSGCFYICMLIFIDIYLQKLGATETILNTIQNQGMNVHNTHYIDDQNHIFVDKVDYISNEIDYIHPLIIICLTVLVVNLCSIRP